MDFDELVRKVDQVSERESFDQTYFYSTNALATVRRDLRRLNDAKHLLRIVKPFLVSWGGLARVVGRKDLDWSLLGQALRGLEKEFAEIRNKRFLTIDLNDEKISNAVKAIYSRLDPLRYFGSPTTISKVLHLLNPEIFVMWDRGIRKMYKAHNTRVRENSEGYLEFLKDVQRELLEALNDQARMTGKSQDEVEREIRDRYRWKTIAKIADEYNWAEAHSLRSYHNVN
jgi:hypothetical protein